MAWIMLAAAVLSVSDADNEACLDSWQGQLLCTAELRLDRADQRLNRQWRATFQYVKSHRGSAAAAKLRASQRAWLRASERNCLAIGATMTTPYQGVTYDNCKTELFDKRTSVLKAMIGRQ